MMSLYYLVFASAVEYRKMNGAHELLDDDQEGRQIVSCAKIYKNKRYKT